MYNKSNSISTEYNNTKITFFQINMQSKGFSQSLWHNHRYYELHFCVKAPLEYTFSNQTLWLNPGELLIIPPNIFHNSVPAAEKQNIRVLSFMVTAEKSNKQFYNAFASALNANALKPLKFPNGSQVDWDVFNQEELYGTLLGICKLKSDITKFIYLLFDCILKEDVIVNGNAEFTVLLDNLINRPDITLDEIATALHYSKRHVSRIIKKQYGVSLSEYRKNIKEASK